MRAGWLGKAVVLALCLLGSSYGLRWEPTLADAAPASQAGGAAGLPGGQCPKRGGTLFVGQSSDPTSINPHRFGDQNARNVIINIYNTLVEHDLRDYSLRPGLAQSWSVSSDGLVWTFKLRGNVKFHDGSDFGAEDAKASLERAMEPTSGRTAPLLTRIRSLEARDKLTLIIRLSQPDRILLSSLVDVYIGPSGVTTEQLSETPNGTGPFKFVRWDRNREVVLERNPNYWKPGLPCVDRLVFRTLPEDSVRSLQLRTGRIHLSSSGLLGEMGSLAAAGVVLHTPPRGFNMGLYNVNINTRREPWKRQEVRQALSWAIDREAIARALFGFVQVLSNPMESNKRYFNPQALSYNKRDLEQARQLLTGAGLSGGVDGGEAIVCGLGFQFNILGQLVQSHAAEAGIRFRLTILDVGTYVARTLGGRRGEFDLAVCAMVPKPDEYDLLNHPYAKLFTQTLGWIDQKREFYDLLEAARSMVDSTRYRQAIMELQAMAMEGQPQLILGGRLDPTPAQPYVKNFVPHTQANTFFEAVWLDR
jgi:ABC-type transport system substrate-binding protein